jgi:hypothetical protein
VAFAFGDLSERAADLADLLFDGGRHIGTLTGPRPQGWGRRRGPERVGEFLWTRVDRCAFVGISGSSAPPTRWMSISQSARKSARLPGTVGSPRRDIQSRAGTE